MRLGQLAVLHTVPHPVLAVLRALLSYHSGRQVDVRCLRVYATSASSLQRSWVAYGVTRYLERELRARGVRRILRVPQWPRRVLGLSSL